MSVQFTRIRLEGYDFSLLQVTNIPALAFLVSETWSTSIQPIQLEVYELTDDNSERCLVYEYLAGDAQLNGTLKEVVGKVCRQHFITRVFIDRAEEWRAQLGVYNSYTAARHAGAAESHYCLEVLDINNLTDYLETFVPDQDFGGRWEIRVSNEAIAA